MARRRSTRKSGVTTDKSRSDKRSEPFEQAEFEQVRIERQLFDFAGWTSAVQARKQVPSWFSKGFDPVVEGRLGERLKTATFIGSDTKRVAVQRAKPSLSPTIEVHVLAVEAKPSTMPGTLIVPVTAADLKNVDPRSLGLYRWDDRTKQYEPVHQSGFDVANGYVYGRIASSGRYAVLAIPIEGALEKLTRAGTPKLAGALSRLIFWRIFDPTGPWSPLGPVNLSCCIMDLAIDPANNDRIYAAASDGGIWRLDSISAYPTATWVALTDGQPLLQVQCLAVSPADSRVIYYVDRSGILYRSDDRGSTWTTPSMTNLGSANRLICHPGDANTIFIATSTGFWCSRTGGTTWLNNAGQTTLHDGDILDAAIDPDDSNIVYIARRSIGLRKSYDGGTTWQTMLAWSRANSPAGTAIRVALGRGGTDATRTVAVRFDQEVIVNRKGGRDVGLSGGGAWTSAGQVGGNGYGDWCHVIAVDPFDDNVILSGGQQLFRTANGGTSWTLVIDYYRPHEDQHRVVFDPTQRGVVYAANDGGVFRSIDDGVTWQVDDDDVTNRRDLTHGLVTAQFYTAAISSDHAMGDLYHQGIAAAESLRLGRWQGVEGHAWEFNNVYGDPTRSGTYYVFGGQLFRRDFPGGALTSISTFTPTSVAVDGSGNVLVGANDGTVRRTTDPTVATPSWTVMLGLSSPGDNVVAMAVAPLKPRHAYAATAGGRIFSCADTAAPTAWTACTRLPTGGVVALAVAGEDESVVFAATSTQIYRSVDGGGTWSTANGSGATAIPPGSQLRSLVAGPGALYAGAAAGVFTSADRGSSWYDFSAGLPNVDLKELLWTGNDLFAVTHGRGIWHHGRYDILVVPGPVAHVPDVRWLIELWLAIHGGDPAPDLIRQTVGKKVLPFRQGEAPRER